MAARPVFVPYPGGPPFVREAMVEFKWHAGLTRTQAQKSIQSLHDCAVGGGISPILEISSKSADPLGVSLSAFNLTLQVAAHPPMSVECAFQGSKVFEGGGPFSDLYSVGSRDAKRDERIRASGKLVGFRFLGEEFPIVPPTAFYDWLYLQALVQNPDLSRQLLLFSGFTDIAFNPRASWNCQARAAAFFVALTWADLPTSALISKDAFLSTLVGKH